MARDVAQFLRSLREKNASPHTIKAYQTNLDSSAYLHSDLDRDSGRNAWEAVDHVRIRGFLSHLYDHGLTKPSVARALAAVRSLFKFLAREKLVKQNPALLVSTPKLPKKLPRVPTIEEMNRVLDTPQPEEAAFPERDQLIFELLYGCGIRNSELTGINMEHIYWSQQGIMVRGKGKKERLVPFGDKADWALRNYLHARQRVLQERREKDAGTDSQSAGPAPDDAQRRTHREVHRGCQWIVARGASAHTAARVWDASAGGRRGPALDPGVAWTRTAGHHATLYAALHAQGDGGLRQDASASEVARAATDVGHRAKKKQILRCAQDDTSKKGPRAFGFAQDDTRRILISLRSG